MKKNARPFSVLYTTAQSTMMGGGQWSLYYLIKGLDKQKYRPVVACPEEGELAEKMRSAGAVVVFYRASRLRAFSFGDVLRLRKVIREHSIVLIHTDSSTETFYAGIAAKLSGVPLVWHIRVSGREPLVDTLLPFFCCRLILVAASLKERFSCSAEKLRVIYNGYNPALMDKITIQKPLLRDAFALPGDALLLGCFGRVEERKGAHILLKTLQDVPSAYLLLVGKEDEEYGTSLRERFERGGVLHRVIFTGHRSSTETASLMKQIDIFCFPVLWGEGFSRSLLEAMSAEKPVVASSDAGNKEAVHDGKTGFIVPAGDEKGFAERVKELSADETLRRTMGQAGRKRVEEEFTLAKTSAEIDALYQELLSVP